MTTRLDHGQRQEIAFWTRVAALAAIVSDFAIYFYGLLTVAFEFPVVPVLFATLAAVVVTDCLLCRRHVIAGIAVIGGVTIWVCGGLTDTFRFRIDTYLILVLCLTAMVDYGRSRGWI